MPNGCNALILDGLRPLQFTYDQVTVEPQWVISQLHTALDLAASTSVSPCEAVERSCGDTETPVHLILAMKTDIHPTYAETTVRCSCGNTFTTRSTKGGELHIELCNECHPFFTGKQKLVDSGGRVERFNKRYGTRKGGTGKK